MRPLRLAGVAIALAACDSDVDVEPAAIQWLEWPAEVRAASPFNARALLTPPVCFPHELRARVSTDDAAVTIASYFFVERVDPVCPPTAASFAPLPNVTMDTLLTIPGLAASSPRTLDMRATANSVEPPIRTFGAVTVRPADPDTSRRNAAGVVALRVDEQGCARIQPGGFFNPGIEYVLEDQADTVGLFLSFVRGYLHEATAPVCGETRVFRLESRN